MPTYNVQTIALVVCSWTGLPFIFIGMNWNLNCLK